MGVRGRLARRIGSTASCLVLGACASAGGSDGLHATLWMQTAVEYRAVAEQAYRSAADALAEALADSSWTAALEQRPGYERLPPAIILDVDETVLDHSVFDARMVRAGTEFDPASWAEWVEEARARAVPGAVPFLRAAVAKGVTAFFISNTQAELEASYRRNFAWLGLPLDPEVDTILLLGERPAWGWDKTSRRAFVAERFRVLLLIGDDLNDFVPARTSREERLALMRRHEERWGRTWFMLPNPLYGSWRDALYGFRSGLSAEEKHRIKLGALDEEGSEEPFR